MVSRNKSLAHTASNATTAEFSTSINPLNAKHDYSRKDRVVYNLLYQPIQLLILGIKYVLKHQDLQMFGPKLNKCGQFSPT